MANPHSPHAGVLSVTLHKGNTSHKFNTITTTTTTDITKPRVTSLGYLIHLQCNSTQYQGYTVRM